MLSIFLCSKPCAEIVKCDGCAYDVDVDKPHRWAMSIFGSWFLKFDLPLYVLKHLIQYQMVSNFINLIQYTVINI